MDALKRSLAGGASKRAAPAEKAARKAAKGKKPKKRAAGQREMLLPISGSGSRRKRAPRKPRRKPQNRCVRRQAAPRKPDD